MARHIELLLRDNDCVILPGFGGFIAHDVPAYYVSEEGQYYPPSRSISFNAAITMNDGLLAQSYMKSHQIDYARANYMIDIELEKLVDILDEEGCVTLPHIGTLTQDIHQSLQFIPESTGIASPRHFGLGSLTIKELSQLSQPSENIQKHEAPISHTAKTIDLHIRKDVLHHVMATAAVFLLLLMVALPTGNHRPTDIASLHLTEIISQQAQAPEAITVEAIPEVCDTTQDTATLPITEEPFAIPTAEEMPTPDMQPTATEAVEVKAPAAEPIEAERAEIPFEAPATPETPSVAEVHTTPAPAAIATSEKTYHIIVASLPSHRGADETLSQYVNMGYTEASLVERDDRVRISIMQFADKNEANRQLSVLRQHIKFQSAWLLAVRN